MAVASTRTGGPAIPDGGTRPGEHRSRAASTGPRHRCRRSRHLQVSPTIGASLETRHHVRMRSDAELLERPHGEPERSASSTTATRRRIHGYHLRRSRDPEAAHDLTAETFAQAWLSRARFRDEAGGSAGPVAVRQSRGTCCSCRCGAAGSSGERVRAPRHRSSGSTARRPAEPDERWLDGLDEALASLPEAQREAIRLRVVEDLGYDEVADASTPRPRRRARASRAASRAARTASTRRRRHDDRAHPRPRRASATRSSARPRPTSPRGAARGRARRRRRARAGSPSRSRRSRSPCPASRSPPTS